MIDQSLVKAGAPRLDVRLDWRSRATSLAQSHASLLPGISLPLPRSRTTFKVTNLSTAIT
jgi:hypothetical protein